MRRDPPLEERSYADQKKLCQVALRYFDATSHPTLLETLVTPNNRHPHGKKLTTVVVYSQEDNAQASKRKRLHFV